jgi:hypothetical protein
VRQMLERRDKTDMETSIRSEALPWG